MPSKTNSPLTILIISYYWSPSGGAGVQRWVKLAKYLSRLGVKCHVLTVDENKASYMGIDHSLAKDIPDSVEVHRTNSFEVLKIYEKLTRKNQVQTGTINSIKNTSLKSRILVFIRSNFFIPDPRKGWNKFAIKKGSEIIANNSIDAIISTGPPHSTHLIARELKKKNRTIQWIADFRDPWTDIYYYESLGHTAYSKKIDARLENKVFAESDILTTVSADIQRSLSTKINKKEKVKVLHNGFDHEDFRKLQKKESQEDFRIVYTGALNDFGNPYVIFDAIEYVAKTSPLRVIIEFVGNVSDRIKNYVEGLQVSSIFTPPVPHSEINQIQKNADLLLLVVPQSDRDKGILTGKLFEYLATTNRIISLGPEDGDLQKILTTCKIGSVFNRASSESMVKQLQKEIDNKINNNIPACNQEEIKKFSRQKQAELLHDIILNK